MTNGEAVNWIINISADIGKTEHSDLWHYEQALCEIRDMLEHARDTNADTISRQAAIDALMAWEENSVWDDECLKHRGEPYWVAPSDVINQMPSTQPEETFEFDKWYDFKRGYVLETTVHSFRIRKDTEASSNGWED